jgi:hypothetical protein
MKRIAIILKKLICIFILSIFVYSCTKNYVAINDISRALVETNAPVSIKMELNKNQSIAAKEGRLAIIDPTTENLIPVQLENPGDEANSSVVLILPEGKSDLYKLKVIENNSVPKSEMKALVNSENGQVIIKEGDKKVLQYNYQTVYEKDVVRLEDDKKEPLVYPQMSGIYFEEYLKSHPEIKKDTLVTGSIYSVPRSDYIHPLYGLDGEMLTNDWPDGGHPHHRGIFWAWPEVEYGSERGDIYALQRVFARPTGNIEFISGPVFAQINAENLWMWEDTEAIVKENAVIRVYRSTTDSRIIDLTIKLLALKDSVTIATRFTDSYGGLNLRMQTPESQEITYFTDETGSKPIRAWSDFNGVFHGNKSPSGLMVLQYQGNPEYPGSWREYPDLAWVQPTFPSPGTRYLLSKEKPLILRFRLIVYTGEKPDDETARKRWDAFHETETPHYVFDKTEN